MKTRRRAVQKTSFERISNLIEICISRATAPSFAIPGVPATCTAAHAVNASGPEATTTVPPPPLLYPLRINGKRLSSINRDWWAPKTNRVSSSRAALDHLRDPFFARRTRCVIMRFVGPQEYLLENMLWAPSIRSINRQ